MDDYEHPGIAGDEQSSAARQLIARRWPALAREIEAADCTLGLELDQSGPIDTLRVDGIRLCSAWEPEQEARLQCGEALDGITELTLFGVGLAVLPPLLLERIPADCSLRIVLMHKGLFNCMLDLIDMQHWLADPRVELASAESVTELPEHFRVTPPMLQLAEREAETLRDWLMQALSDNHMRRHQCNVQTLLQSNLQSNLELHADDPDVAQCWIHHARSRQVAVVVGAGPSLDHAFAVIRALQIAGARVIAVDAALVSLMRNGVVPDYIVSIDPLPTISRFFKVNLQALAKSALIYFPTVHPDVVHNWPHARYVAVGRHPRYQSYSAIKPTTALFSSGSVIHPAVDLATRLAATQIQLAGADFGFPFQSTHAKGVAGASKSARLADSRLVVRNYHGQAMPSQMNFISYYRDLEQFIAVHAQRGLEFRNIGHFSARMRNVRVTPVASSPRAA